MRRLGDSAVRTRLPPFVGTLPIRMLIMTDNWIGFQRDQFVTFGPLSILTGPYKPRMCRVYLSKYAVLLEIRAGAGGLKIRRAGRRKADCYQTRIQKFPRLAPSNPGGKGPRSASYFCIVRREFFCLAAGPGVLGVNPSTSERFRNAFPPITRVVKRPFFTSREMA